ncbi:hypothetical protein D3871_15480 [Noviherbaspirillum saxi]|uniref:Uncharacterized protein n=1 Tax=Noviherbaspirillum saxi TaxID=2320863 RepID=A0A3A3G109_9BURK|nr:hypothetical protein D3871_15480 [Noviherbaspirillum saxi]
MLSGWINLPSLACNRPWNNCASAMAHAINGWC